MERRKKVRSFEDLEVWKKASRLAVELCEHFQETKDWGFRNQVCRAAVSVPSNIAEGFERASTKEFVQFLFIAKGSAGELRTQLYLAIELGYIGKSLGIELIDKCRHVSSMIQKLIMKLKQKDDE